MESFQIDYITGEKLQECADHTIILNIPSNGASDLIRNQLKNINCKYTYFEPTGPIQLGNDIQSAKSIFVYTHILPFFFQKIYPLLTKPFVLISHNSDNCVDEQYAKFLNEDKIIKWFAQNVNYKHLKLIPIPIGIANAQWPHGNLKIFDDIKKENNLKNTLVYKNFDINTSQANRWHVHQSTNQNGILMSPKKPYIEYLRDISRSIFTICPMGNGIDTHRMWESLYLNTIPIVADCAHNRGFDNLPIVYIPQGQSKNWNIITKDFLLAQLQEINNKQFSLDKLKLSYWKNQILEATSIR